VQPRVRQRALMRELSRCVELGSMPWPVLFLQLQQGGAASPCAALRAPYLGAFRHLGLLAQSGSAAYDAPPAQAAL